MKKKMINTTDVQVYSFVVIDKICRKKILEWNFDDFVIRIDILGMLCFGTIGHYQQIYKSRKKKVLNQHDASFQTCLQMTVSFELCAEQVNILGWWFLWMSSIK